MMDRNFFICAVLFVFIFYSAGCSVKQKPAALNPAGENKTEEVSAFIPVQSRIPAVTSAQTPPAPLPEGDAASWDFGVIPAGQIVKHEFTLTNTSRMPLAISAINTSCGCAVPEVKKRSLSPGENTVIEVSFNSTGYSGSVEQYIFVHTDRADNPVLKFTIKAEVVK
ncbi:MAG: DUF1573 domain-containing protein [Candidatus Omnitrophica bacterium]|nr:DUF1573 domain-containing protein [Candidatus Omnitrophota bacterium]